MNISQALRDRGVGVGKKLRGNAAAADVRAGKTFSNADGNDKTGTLAVRATGAQVITPGTANVTKEAGIYDGTITVEGSAALISSNIKAGATVFGVAGKKEVVDTTEAAAAATAGQIRNGRAAFVNGAKVTGTLAVQSTLGLLITPGTADIVKAAGIYDGAITVEGSAALISSNIKAGVTIFGVPGAKNVIDTTEGIQAVNEAVVLDKRTAFVNGVKVTGSMTNHGAYNVNPARLSSIIPQGYHSGSGQVLGDNNLVPANIKAGVSLFGVAGSLIPGPRTARGSATSSAEGKVTVRGLTFRPTIILIKGYNATSSREDHVVYVEPSHFGTLHGINVVQADALARPLPSMITWHSDGFTSPVVFGNGPYEWVVYGPDV